MMRKLAALSFIGFVATVIACSSMTEPGPSDGSGGEGGDTSGSGSGSGTGGATLGSGGTTTPVEPAEVLPCFIDEGEPAGGAIQLAVVANRVSGVAPLSVFFDTQGTTADATTRPYHDLAYCWDFGDEDAGAYATTGLSKNQGRGPTVGHVYEAPGTYSVTVSVRDSEGRVTSSALEIEVEDPDEVFAGSATTCVSASGDFDDCPEGADQVTASSLSDAQDAVAPGRRILVHRGEDYTGGFSINTQGPGLIGAYGDADAARPKITATGSVFRISSRTPDFDDWRIVDFDIQGDGDDSGGVNITGKATDLLVLRMRTVEVGAPVEAPDTVLDYWNQNGDPGHDAIDGLTLAECEFRDIVGGSGHNANYLAVHRLLILGSIYRNSSQGEHLLRTPWIDRGWIANTTFAESPAPRHLIKMHGPNYANPESIGYQKFTERVVVSDNIFDGAGGHDWSVSIAPKNDTSDERVRDIIVERNLFLPGPSVQTAVQLAASDVTVRENLFNRGEEATCVSASTRGIEPPGTRISIYNNTFFTSGERLVLASIGSDVTESFAYNNLVIGENVSEIEIRGVEAEAGNLLLQPSDITTVPPLAIADFGLTEGSVAIDAAEAAGPWTPWDYEGRPAPIDGDAEGGASADIGALEFVP